MHVLTRILATAALAALASGCASTASSPPETTYDGLVRDHSAKNAEVYRKPGASLAEYQEYGLAPCQVAFKKNWMRDQNRDRVDLTSRVTQKDVDRIKDTLSAECDKYFRAALEEPPAYKLVDEFMDGEKVLIIQPAIINLDVAAPDTMSAGMSRTYTTSAGEMTMFLQLVDATTHEVLVRAVDRRRGMDTGRLSWTNSVTNKADADRALKFWAGKLRGALDAAHEGS